VLYLTKHELIEEAFGINDSVDLNKVQNMRNKLCEYIKNHGEDSQIRNIIIMLDVFIIEEKYGNYVECYFAAEPVFRELSQTDDWDFCDARVCATLIDYYSADFEKLDFQAEKVLEKLEKFSHEERYPHIKSALHMNMLLRLVQAKYSINIYLKDPVVTEKLNQMFSKHYEEIFNADGFPVRKAVAKIRKGRFSKDQSLIDEGYKTQEDLGENNYIESLEKELVNSNNDEKYIEDMSGKLADMDKRFKKQADFQKKLWQ